MAPVAFRFRREHSCWLLEPPDLVSNLTASIGLTQDESLVRIEQIQKKISVRLSLENLIRLDARPSGKTGTRYCSDGYTILQRWMLNRVRDVSLAYSVYLIDDLVGRWQFRLMQWSRRVDDKIHHLVAQILASASPDRSVLSGLRTPIRQYGHRRAAENFLVGRRKDD